jgi:hypothetical protein
MPIISATREKTQRLLFETSLTKLARSCLKSKPSVVAHSCGPSYSKSQDRRIIVKAGPCKLILRICLKNKQKAQKIGSMAQVVECLLNKYEALNLIPVPLRERENPRRLLSMSLALFINWGLNLKQFTVSKHCYITKISYFYIFRRYGI